MENVSINKVINYLLDHKWNQLSIKVIDIMMLNLKRVSTIKIAQDNDVL